jgi:hypothetical protein
VYIAIILAILAILYCQKYCQACIVSIIPYTGTA